MSVNYIKKYVTKYIFYISIITYPLCIIYNLPGNPGVPGNPGDPGDPGVPVVLKEILIKIIKYIISLIDINAAV